MIKKITTFVLSMAIALGLTGCTFSAPATVVNVDGEDVAAGIYLIYQYGAYTSAQNKVEDKTKDLFKQDIEGVKAEEWIYNETLKNVKTYVYIEKAFKESGIAFSEEELSGVNSQLDAAFLQDEKTLAKNGIGKESFMAYNMSEAKKAKLYSDKFVKDSANNVTDADARKYMEEKYSRIASASLPVTTASYEQLDTEKTKEVKALADELLAKVKAGGTIDKETAAPMLKKAFELTSRDYTEEVADQYITKNFIHAAATTYPPEIVAKLVAAKVGDCGIEDVYGAPFVWHKVKTVDDDKEFELYKPSVINEIQQKAFIDGITAITDKYTVTPNSGAVKTYSPKKIKTK
ncbi:MAG: hypothetical protein RR576_08070 [Oscillospiraceae bacterium]